MLTDLQITYVSLTPLYVSLSLTYYKRNKPTWKKNPKSHGDRWEKNYIAVMTKGTTISESNSDKKKGTSGSENNSESHGDKWDKRKERG